MTTPPAPPVFVVDDEEPVRASLGKLLRVLGFDSSTYASAESFLESYPGNGAGCLLLDLRMPGMSGLDLLEELTRRQTMLATIVMTGQADAQSVERLSAYDTLGFLEKPFSVEQLKAILARWRDLPER